MSPTALVSCDPPQLGPSTRHSRLKKKALTAPRLNSEPLDELPFIAKTRYACGHRTLSAGLLRK
jgi:hypothetical protein